MKSVINVNCDSNCFKYALLSILHFDEIKKDRQRTSKYEQWENELNFGDVNVEEVNISSDVSKVELLNDLKINIHVWDNGLKGCVYNNRKNVAPRTVNLLLVVNKENQRHFCGIPSLSRLYNHIKSSQNQQFMCERCIRSFSTKNYLGTHYEWCVQGKPQIEEMPKQKEFSYKSFGQELSPVKVIYADAE